MLRALKRWALRFSHDENQLALELAPSARPTTGAELRDELRRLGLRHEFRIRLTQNRTVVVSYGRGELRIHQSFLDAPEEVWRAIIVFVHGRTRAARNNARRTILRFPVKRAPAPRRKPRPHATHPDDRALSEKLQAMHDSYNRKHFAGALRTIPVRISRRMKSRLGHYSAATEDGLPAEIVISRRHIRRHGWEEALHTLLHEMVHQWQDENDRAIDHGPSFRTMARAVGIAPSATRRVA
jgi:hypothetical protein